MSINLLPWRIHEKTVFRQKQIIAAIVSFIFYAIISVFLRNALLIRIHTMQKNSIEINKKIAEIPVQAIEARKTLLNKLIWLKAEKIKSTQFNHRLQDFLTKIANDLPLRITLQSLTISDEKNTLAGAGEHIEDIHTYAQSLQKEFKTVALSDIHNEPNDNTKFYFMIQVAL